jgi:hypothetical protein
MIKHDSDTNDDEIVNVQLPRKDYKVLRDILEREKTWSWIARWMKSGLLWAIVGSMIILMNFWEQIKRALS